MLLATVLYANSRKFMHELNNMSDAIYANDDEFCMFGGRSAGMTTVNNSRMSNTSLVS